MPLPEEEEDDAVHTYFDSPPLKPSKGYGAQLPNVHDDAGKEAESLEGPLKARTTSEEANERIRIMRLNLPSTPSASTRKSHKFYCPICMDYYMEILQSGCCKNYICSNCAKGFVGKKLGHVVHSIPTIQLDIECPLCNTDDVILLPVMVGSMENVRSYQESPQTKALMQKVNDEKKLTKHGSSNFRGSGRKSQSQVIPEEHNTQNDIEITTSSITNVENMENVENVENTNDTNTSATSTAASA